MNINISNQFLKFQTTYQLENEKAKIEDVWQAEVGITNSTDSSPILGTDGLGPCIGVAGWDPNKKIGFLAHFHSEEQIQKCFNKIFSALKSCLNSSEKSYFEVAIVGGENDIDASYDDRHDMIKAELLKDEEIKCRVVYEDIARTGDSTRSLLIDTRNGIISSYNSINNPNVHRRSEELYCLHQRFLVDIWKKRCPDDLKIGYFVNGKI